MISATTTPETTQEAEVETDDVSRLRAAIGALARRLRHTEATAGMTQTQVSVLLSVVAHGSLRAGALAEHEGLNPTMLSRVLAVLCERGLVRRVADPTDRRATIVEPTAAGRKLRERMRRERNAKLEPVLAELTGKERAAIVAALPALETLAELLVGRRP
jgi:DNA-binding MarR family transcriptional regulator